MAGDKKNARGDGRRIPRVEKEIREVIGLYLLQSMRGELSGLVSVSRVIASGDLRTAKVLVTVMGDDSNKKEDLQILNDRAGEIQQQINRKLQMRHCPRLSFHYDDGFDNALKVEGILRQIGLSKKPLDPEDKDSES
jgi:ribosome-binding factor A